MTARKIRSSSRRGEAVMHMDAIQEILARLPVKQVLRCKLLSKSYYNLIKTPSFINRHLLHHQSDSKTIVVSKSLEDDRGFNRMVCPLDESQDGFEVLFLPPITRFCWGANTPVGSCNGLLVLQLIPDHEDLTVCNPATREYRRIPRPSLAHMADHSYFLDALGFVYDAKSGDYKLVKIGDYSGEGNNGPCVYLIEIWTMKSNSWKQINPPMPSLFLEKEYKMTHPHHGLLVNRILYWLAYAKDESDRDAFILSFDPTHDTFGQIVLPKDVLARSGQHDLCLIDFNGSLALSIGLPSGDSHTLFDIWVMMNNTAGSSSSWTKRFSIGPLPLDMKTTQVCTKEGKFVLYRIVCRHRRSCESWQFISYDAHHSKVLKESSTVDQISINTTAWSYIESLVPVPQT